MKLSQQNNWTIINKNTSTSLKEDFKNLIKYFFLIKTLTYKDFIAVFKQSILGPAWFFIQPLATSAVFTVIFGRVAEISTDGSPPFLFYMSGVLIWSFFAALVGRVSNILFEYESILKKTYFPAIILPFSVININIIKSTIQFIPLVAFVIIYNFDNQIVTSIYIIPVLTYVFLITILLSCGIGFIFASMTTKYKDLHFIHTFAIGLMMYATPVVYPLSSAEGKLYILLSLNPVTSLIEILRYFLLGQGTLDIFFIIYSLIISFLIFVIGLIFYKKVINNFVDTI